MAMNRKGRASRPAPSLSRSKPINKRVYLVGSAESKTATPWADTGADIWVLNQISFEQVTPRWTAWFELHQRPYIQGNYESFLRSIGPGRQLYMIQRHEDIPASVAYPLEEILDRFGARYFTSTPAYMLALAIHLGYEEIGLYGLAMETGSEYAYERPAMEWLIGHAMGRGIKVHVEKPSSLLKAERLYGFEEAYTASGATLNVSPDELITMLGHEELDRQAWQARLERLQAYVTAMQAGQDPGPSPDLDPVNLNIQVTPPDLMYFLGRTRALAYAAKRECNVIAGHVRAMQQGIITTRLAPAAQIEAAGDPVPKVPAENGKEPAGVPA